MVNCIKIGHLINSSLWITVFIVRVGCLIEAQALEDTLGKDVNKDEDLVTASATFALSRQARLRKKTIASSSVSSSGRRIYSSKNFLGSSSSTPTVPLATTSMIGLLPAVENESDDTCSEKADGYFPNYGSGCSSYYFCAAGYQITYVCPPDTLFNEKSKKCEDDAKCLSKGHAQNVCGNVANGYYTNDVDSPKYFYCYNNAKVIDLTCDYGKVFNGNKCILHHMPQQGEESQVDLENVSCTSKPNGFYPIIQSACVKYYFCIDHVKTELQCEAGLVFNSEICVDPSRYKCPTNLANSSTGNSINTSNNTINDNARSNLKENAHKKRAESEDTKSHEPSLSYFETTSLPLTTVF